MVYKHEIAVPYIVSKFKQHADVKEQLLDLIDKQDCVALDDHEIRISRTDWISNVGPARDYWNFLFPMLEEHMKDVMLNLNIKEYNFTNYWFQQYKHLDTHGWHRHRHCFFSSVYYIELPKDGPSTIFKNPVDGKTILRPEIEEGDIITFPSIIEHCSAPNQSTNKKTVISFNVV